MKSDWFDAMAVRDWLGNRIDLQKQLKSTDDFNSQISASITPDTVQITEGIDIIADILGEIMKEEGNVGKYFKYCFWYKGTKVFQLSEERLV